MDILNEEIEEFEINLPNGDTTKLISSKLDEFINKLDRAMKSVILVGKGIH